MSEAADGAAPTQVYGLSLDGDGVVVGGAASNVAQFGMTTVARETYDAAMARICACRLVDGVLVPYAPPARPALPPTVTGNQWIFALKTLRLSDAWELAVARSKTSDRQRWGAISRDVVIVDADPLLARIAGNAGTDVTGRPAIDPAEVFARARREPT